MAKLSLITQITPCYKQLVKCYPSCPIPFGVLILDLGFHKGYFLCIHVWTSRKDWDICPLHFEGLGFRVDTMQELLHHISLSLLIFSSSPPSSSFYFKLSSIKACCSTPRKSDFILHLLPSSSTILSSNRTHPSSFPFDPLVSKSFPISENFSNHLKIIAPISINSWANPSFLSFFYCFPPQIPYSMNPYQVIGIDQPFLQS